MELRLFDWDWIWNSAAVLWKDAKWAGITIFD
jgi:hypothetical protein